MPGVWQAGGLLSGVAMKKRSAGILVYRLKDGRVEVFLVHPGGPFWKNKDNAAWSIPKGEFTEAEDPMEAAIREFEEETGLRPTGRFEHLGERKQPSGKTLYIWSNEGDCDPESIKSNTFLMEWPPNSGVAAEFPEVDRAAWFSIDDARRKLHKGQVIFLDRLLEKLGTGPRILYE